MADDDHRTDAAIDRAALAMRERDGSGHGLLLVILGEFVWQTDGNAEWQATLVRALEALGVTENATRKAMQRMGEANLLAFERHGRRTRCVLTPRAVALFEQGGRRVFDFEPQLADWDGRWLVVAASVPETQRKLRHLLRARLQRAGLGSPAPGLWITPHADLPVANLIGDVEGATAMLSFVGSAGPLGDERAMAAAAWDLPALGALYREFTQRYHDLRPAGDEATFAAYVGLIQAWRRFPFLDPRLPERFLPSPWPGLTATALFRERRAVWGAPARRFWNTLRA